ncbi:FAD-binding domain-containing protein [Bimuria novae-zelandiae CBS 107.79]|uniref:FAD-binding domain-containing protein n=1 Tax=Bimuria novae-zelandiae CBS 107.79 TaxID=1447943 RepID=A0A6A5VAL1_9PLEO|nr:FAD-binding domain-containing protein [Bimuria novae-zelandiae CBS 107.79]
MPASTVLKALSSTIPPDQLVIKGTEESAKLNKSYLSLLQSELEPAAILLPRSKEDVVTIVKLLKPYVLSGDVQFAVRGAGQQPLPGCSNISGDGLTIDLWYLKGIEIKDGSVFIGAGEIWGSVYEKLAEHGLGVTGSRSALGGIGGLALADGLSFSSREGFICDNVLAYDIVLSTGTLITASPSSHPSLFRALRGGGNNFGIITRFELRTFPQGPSGALNKPDADPETHVMISQAYIDVFKEVGDHFCMNQAYYTREVCAYMNTTVAADAATLTAASDIFTAAFQPLKDLEGLTCAFTLQSYPRSLLSKCTNNSLGLDASTPLMSILLMNWWKNAADDERVIQTFKQVIEKIDADAEQRGTAVKYKYMNYAYSFQDPIRSYGEEEMGRLREVSGRFDAEGVFQKGVLGGFKLF